MKGWQPVEILKQMCAIYASDCVVLKMGRQQTTYKQGPAQAYTVSKVENNAWVKNVLRQTLESLFPGNGTGYECQYCAHNNTGSWIAGHRNVCSQWVAHVLTDMHKEISMSLLMEHLQWYHTDSDVFLQWTVVCHEIWCHHFGIKSRHAMKMLYFTWTLKIHMTRICWYSDVGYRQLTV
jgi:hypothetical protein